MKHNLATIHHVLNEYMSPGTEASGLRPLTPMDMEINRAKELLRARCQRCNVNPEYCPAKCYQKLSPIELLGEELNIKNENKEDD